MDPCGTPQTIPLGGDKQLFTWHRRILLDKYEQNHFS